MESMQTWGSRFNIPQPTAIPKSLPQITLSREEQLEAKRLAEEANFSFDGYQVVRREFISHRFDPAMTIRGTSITFNNSCISKLENATYIQFLIAPPTKPCHQILDIKGISQRQKNLQCDSIPAFSFLDKFPFCHRLFGKV